MDAFVTRSKKTPPRKAAPPVVATIPDPNNDVAPDRPAKRVKVEEVANTDDETSENDFNDESHISLDSKPEPQRHDFSLEPESQPEDPDEQPDVTDRKHETAIESSLPEVRTDKEAIREYEAMRASQGAPDDAASRIDSRKWVRGKSSIYVDAFNLALDTVLEDEAHLFDEKEMAVFHEWKALNYEAQYLYVRLFLRKTAAWHRADRLTYYSDIADPDAAIKTLQEARELPDVTSDLSQDSPDLAGVPLQEWLLNESFTFADTSEDCITTVKEAVSLLNLDELKVLAKEARVQGKNKADIQKALVRMSARQSSLMSHGLRRHNTNGSMDSASGIEEDGSRRGSETPDPQDSNRNSHFLAKIMAITGSCIRISPSVFKLFERVHLVFYRSTEWTEKSLTTIILAKISRRNFPEYLVCRSANMFPSRRHLLEFEQAMRMEFEVDQILEFGGPPTEVSFRRVLTIYDSIATQWRALIREEQRKEDHVYEFHEGGYLRRLTATHAFTRIAHKAAYVMGRLHDYKNEHALLTELLEQQLFHPARRGAWYQRKALLEEHYMFEIEPSPDYTDPEMQKKHWRRIAAATCEQALEDRDCHLIYHYDLQKRLLKLEKRLKIPKRLQHDFGHVRLHAPEEHTVEGIQIKRIADPKPGRGINTKTIWVDTAEGGGECSVEAMCLSHYREQGWKGYHAEGGIVRTLFAYLFYDILFLYIPNVFQTAFQTCPLDLHSDAFFPARASEINRRLAEIANGEAPAIVQRVHDAHAERRTCVVGLNWDFEVDDLVELVGCFRGEALAAVCKVMAQEYRQRGGGVPDLLLWRTEPEKEVLFAEVKSANDRLMDTQRVWIHVLTGAGVRVALTAAVAKEIRELD